MQLLQHHRAKKHIMKGSTQRVVAIRRNIWPVQHFPALYSKPLQALLF